MEQRATFDEEDKLLHHSSWKKKSPSIDRYGSTSIDTQPHQPNNLRASTDNAYFPSINTNVDATRDRDYSIGNWVDDRYTRATQDPDGYARAINERTLHVSREDIADILQTANRADNLFIHLHNIPEHQQNATKEFYDTTGGIDKNFKQRTHHPTQPSIDVDVPTSVDRRPGYSTGKRRMSMESTEMIRDTPEIQMDTPFVFTTEISEDFWKELQEMSQPTSIFRNMLAHSHKPS
ncbi:hypothetical protein F2Q68_00010002 [Brassica cretica]|uniref:Uncharacterized protein n=1 Tax=Brassica cretica TaxID=69181 RepID=A0A8S9KYQ5_BRACR|nr:hypothetical protein F2Q68_00010002 [Brassica cretica]